MAIRYALSLEELAQILFKHFDIPSGEWEIGFNLNIQSVNSSVGEDKPAPTVVIRTIGLNLVEASQKAPHTYSPAQPAARTATRTPSRRRSQ